MNPIRIVIGEVNLTDISGGIAITETDAWNSPVRDVVPQALALTSGAVSSFQRWQPKVITIKGWVNQADRAELEKKIDAVKRELYDREAPLKVTYAPENNIRTWTVTLIDAKFERQNLPDHADFTLQLWAGNPIATGQRETITSRSVSNSGGSASLTNFYTNNFQGTSTASILPVINFSIPQWTKTGGAVADWLEIGNDGTRQYIRFDFSNDSEKRLTFTAQSGFRIDFLNRRAYLNNQIVATSGVWPEWSPSQRTLALSVRAVSSVSFRVTLDGYFWHRYI